MIWEISCEAHTAVLVESETELAPLIVKDPPTIKKAPPPCVIRANKGMRPSRMPSCAALRYLLSGREDDKAASRHHDCRAQRVDRTTLLLTNGGRHSQRCRSETHFDAPECPHTEHAWT